MIGKRFLALRTGTKGSSPHERTCSGRLWSWKRQRLGTVRSASMGSMMEKIEKNYPAYYAHLTNGNTHSRPTDSVLFLAFGLTGCFAAVEAAAG